MTSWGHLWALRVHRCQPREVGAKDPGGCGWAERWLRHAQPVALGSLGKTGHSLQGHLYPMPPPGSLGAPADPGQELEAGKGRGARKQVGGRRESRTSAGSTAWGSKGGEAWRGGVGTH